MHIIAKYTNESGEPVLGLTPQIQIFQIDNDTLIVNNVDMAYSNFRGFYEYEFVGYDSTKIYEFWIDGGNTLEDYYRYQWGVITPDDEKRPVIKFD